MLSLIWGTTWKVIQVGLHGIPPFTGVSVRFLLAGLLLLAAARIRGIRLGTSATERRLWVANGLFSFAISYGVVYWAEQWVPSGLASVLFATYPLFVAILAHFLLPAERWSWREGLGVIIGFGGVGVIFSEDFALLGGSQVAVGATVMLLSPIAAALGSVAVKKWGSAIHPWSITSVPMVLAGAALGVVALAVERGRTLTFDAVSVSALLYLTVLGTVVTFTIYYWLLAHVPVKRLALIAYIIPIVAVGLGTALGEPLTPKTVLGSACVILGVAAAVQR